MEEKGEAGAGGQRPGASGMRVWALFLCLVAAWGESAILWAEHSKLSWSDFKGRAPRTVGEPSAVTETGFRMQLVCRAGSLDIDVAAEFYPGSSWVKANRKSGELLRHEQGHFDITELYAKKMKKAVRDAGIGCEDDARAEAEGKRVVGSVNREWEKAEKDYDVETKDGTDLVRQRGVSERIAGELGRE